ncbi:hypothetical protein KKB83_03215 [Patescibacteria group bacterium]|nr:hypothetical protein [Patescibacteria group bacterium]
MKKSWGLIPMIKSGKKKAESRWYKTRIAPWGRVHIRFWSSMCLVDGGGY